MIEDLPVAGALEEVADYHMAAEVCTTPCGSQQIALHPRRARCLLLDRSAPTQSCQCSQTEASSHAVPMRAYVTVSVRSGFNSVNEAVERGCKPCFNEALTNLSLEAEFAWSNDLAFCVIDRMYNLSKIHSGI